VEGKSTLLIVEDDPDVAEMLSAYFSVLGYHALIAEAGEAAVQICRAQHPDLIILDIRLPDIDGYEVARRLRTTQRTLDIPIIFLTERRHRSDRLLGLELGADDYITKPFDMQELGLRVRNALRRASQGTLTNPVTLLSEGALVDERLRECFESDDWAILLISLDCVDNFRESYGFVAADDVLRAISLMIHNAVREYGQAQDFIGHFDPTSFIVVVSPTNVSPLLERLTARLTPALDYFYPVSDRDNLQPNRLSLRFSSLFAQQGPFDDLEALKAALRKG
jgi:PleD family two-component response regulator